MQVVEQYLYLPGCCGFCHSSNLPVIDTGHDLDRVNDPNDPNPSAIYRLYICADCAVSFTQLVADRRGVRVVQQVWAEEMENNIETLTRNNLEKQNQIDEMSQALRVVKMINEVKEDQKPVVGKFKVVTSPDGE
jgi:hypothetical protein